MEIQDVLLSRNLLLSPAFIYAQIHRCHLTDFLLRKSLYLLTLQKPLYDFISSCTIQTNVRLRITKTDLDGHFSLGIKMQTLLCVVLVENKFELVLLIYLSIYSVSTLLLCMCRAV